MSGQLEIPFAIGEKVWNSSHNTRIEDVKCPECAGTKIITMINGVGESFALDCACCSQGFDGPRGWIRRTVYQFEPREFVCRRVNISGNDITYSEAEPDSNCYQSAYVKDLHKTLEEAREACAKKNVQYQKDHEERMTANLKSKRKDMAWSVHYWGGKVRDLKADLARAEAQLGKCKERVVEKLKA